MCYYQFEKTFMPQNTKRPLAAHLVSQEGLADQGWYFNSGANYHITNDLNNLFSMELYKGSEKVIVGNRENLLISHSDNTFVPILVSCSLRIFYLFPK